MISLFVAGMGFVKLVPATQSALAERFALLEQFCPLEVTHDSQSKLVISFLAKGRVAIAPGDPIGEITEMESGNPIFLGFLWM